MNFLRSILIILCIVLTGKLLSQKQSPKIIIDKIVQSIGNSFYQGTGSGCNFIQVRVIFDNNCNNMFDLGDLYSTNTIVSLTGPNSQYPDLNTNENGHVFYSNIGSGSYSTNISMTSGYQVSSETQSIYLNQNEIEVITYFLCEACDCLDTSGVPEPSLTIPNAVFPGMGLIYRITDPDFDPWEVGAYNSNEFTFVVFNRWGGEVYRQTRKDCNGLKNGEIYWNGKDNNGDQLQQDNYNAYLVLQNCEHYCNNDHWSENFINGLFDRCPDNVRYFNIILTY